jgi:hypothetical protein
MTGDCHVRILESVGVKSPCATCQIGTFGYYKKVVISSKTAGYHKFPVLVIFSSVPDFFSILRFHKVP